MATKIWVNTDSGNGLLPDGTKPLPEPVLTGHQWSPATFILGQFHKRYLNHQSIKSLLKMTYLKFHLNFPGANELNRVFEGILPHIWKVCTHCPKTLTHWGRVTHICVGNLTIIGPDNGLSPGQRQAIIRTNAGILLIEPLRTNFSEISIEIHTFSFKEMHLKMSSGKWRPFCLSLNVLRSLCELSVLIDAVSLFVNYGPLVGPGTHLINVYEFMSVILNKNICHFCVRNIISGHHLVNAKTAEVSWCL